MIEPPVVLELERGPKFTFIPYKGGGEIATQLVGQHASRHSRSETRGRVINKRPYLG